MADDPISRLELVKVEIDKIFGRDFFRDHPDLTSAVMLSAAMDCLVDYVRTFARPLIEERVRRFRERERALRKSASQS
jgi:hypothetical protein